MKPGMPDIEPDIPNSAVSVYDQGDAMEDFPVLRAFQQYVDAEQAKSRKRLLSMGIFFGILMAVVIAVFLILLVKVSERNQSLNDKMLEFVMKEHDRDREKLAQQQQQPAPAAAPVVVQPPQDNTAILALTTKLDEMQKKLMDSQAATEKAMREKSAAEAAAIEAAKPKGPSAQELEIERLKKLLEDQKADKKAAEEAEKKRKKEEELEAYRRKYYPELYAPKKTVVRKPRRRVIEVEEDLDEEDLDIDLDLDDEEEDVVVVPKRKTKVKTPSRNSTKTVKPVTKEEKTEDSPKKVVAEKEVKQPADTLLEELNDSKAINYFNDEDKEDEPKVEAKAKAKAKVEVETEKKVDSDWQIPEE